MKILKSVYLTLRYWFDPAMEGSPYDGYKTRRVEKRMAKDTERWLSRRWVKISCEA